MREFGNSTDSWTNLCESFVGIFTTQAPVEDWWPSATKWSPLGPLAGKIEVRGTMHPSFELLWRADRLCPHNLGPCLCMGLVVFFVLFIMGHPQEVSLKVL